MSDEAEAVAEVENEVVPPATSPEPVKPPAIKPSSRLSDSQIMLARRIAADAFEASSSRKSFAKAFIADKRLDGATDDESKALLVCGKEFAEYWLAEKIDKPTALVKSSSRTFPIIFPLLLAFVSLFATGCSSRQWCQIPHTPETPVANIPTSLRWQNWPDTKGSGSCVIASTCSLLEWSNRHDLAVKFRKSYAGGQTETSISKIYRANGIPFIAPKDEHDHGDPKLLQWASDTRRAAIIWYFDNHCVTFCGFGIHEGNEVAWLLDNNRVKQFIPIPKRQFLTNWRSKYGGFAAIPLLTPAPSIPFSGYEYR